MKLDIDLADPRALLKAKTELTRLLNIVEYALNQLHARNGSEQQTPPLPINSTRPLSPIINRALQILESEQPVLDVIDRLPQQFTTSDVIIGLGAEGKEKRNAVKFALNRAVNANRLRLIAKGAGRRPSRYEKLVATMQ